MNDSAANWRVSILSSGLLLIACLTQVGCVTYANYTVPAGRVPQMLKAEPRSDKVPINLAQLSQNPPSEYILGPGDLIGVYVHGVLPPKVDETATVLPQPRLSNQYYPAYGALRTPAVGVPIDIQADGKLQLPLVDPITVGGLTIPQAVNAIRKAYLAADVLPEEKNRVIISLLRPRVHRVVVMREDADSPPTLLPKQAVPFTKIGHAEVIDLPAFENDVLHALAVTGGMPGLDAYNEVWVLRSRSIGAEALNLAQRRVQAGELPEEVLRPLLNQTTAIRIPLRLRNGEPLPFRPQDVVLQTGDVLYLQQRSCEYFYVGGLIQGGRIPLPRDTDLDILEAISLAQSSIGAPAGQGGVSLYGASRGPGQIVPPTRAVILRKLPNGQQLSIRVDVSRAVRDPKERIIIQADDFVMLYYKPGEQVCNVVMNWFDFGYSLIQTP